METRRSSDGICDGGRRTDNTERRTPVTSEYAVPWLVVETPKGGGEEIEDEGTRATAMAAGRVGEGEGEGDDGRGQLRRGEHKVGCSSTRWKRRNTVAGFRQGCPQLKYEVGQAQAGCVVRCEGSAVTSRFFFRPPFNFSLGAGA